MSEENAGKKIDETIHLKPVESKPKISVFPLSFDENIADSFRGPSTNQQNITGFTSIRDKNSNAEKVLNSDREASSDKQDS